MPVLSFKLNQPVHRPRVKLTMERAGKGNHHNNCNFFSSFCFLLIDYLVNLL
jgi:hypothetical protein